MKKLSSNAPSKSVSTTPCRTKSTAQQLQELPSGDILKQAKNKYYLKREHLNLAAATPIKA